MEEECENRRCILCLEEHLAKEKEHLQKEEEWKAAEHFFRQQDEACKATEHLFKQQEAHKAAEHLFRQQDEARKVVDHLFKQQREVRKAREDVLKKWEHIQLNIRELSRALGSETNKVLKNDRETDICVLINRTNQLSDRLYIN